MPCACCSSSTATQPDKPGPRQSKGKGLAFDPLPKPKSKRAHPHAQRAAAAAAGPFDAFGGFAAIPPDIADQDELSAGFQRMMAEIAQGVQQANVKLLFLANHHAIGQIEHFTI